MSQEKAQLIAPQGHFTVPGLNVAGVVTASSFSGNCTGTASSIAQGTNVVVGVMTASSFAGDVFGNAAGLSTTTAGLKLGIVTATSFAGNFTGIGSGLTGTPNIVAGLVTASQFVGNTPGLAAGISAGKNLAAGIVTATTFYGDGSNLTGAGSTAFIRQDVTAVSGTTTINLNDGNIIYLTHSNNTTIAFSNVKTADDVTIIRTLTDNTITWPAAITWNGGTTPTLASANSYSLSGQVFNLVTADGGTTWYGYEEVNNTSSQPHTLWSWGSNSYGNLGHNQSTPTKISSPVQVGSDAIWKSVNIWGNSRFASTAMKSADNTLWMWGYNDTGALAQNNTTQRSSPVQIPGTTWGSVVLGGPQSWIGTKTDGTLWMAGGNANGQLGQNSTTQYSSPVQIPGTTWASGTDKISYGNRQALAIKTDGTLWTWGEDTQGQLGQNELIERSSPVQIPGTTWSSISSHHYANFATKTDGTLWAWGWNVWGVLGINIHYAPSNKGRSSPVQIPGTTWSSVSVNGGRYAAAAIKTDGTLWAWGLNGPGMLGQNNLTAYSSPVQIPGTTWSSVSSGGYHFTATKTDGTGWAWGYNAERGELGQNNLTNYSSPIQIPGTWSELQAGMYRTFGTKTP